MLCIGHRGARGYEPENTLRSIRRALELGADGIEIDVHFLQGELVVIHDATLDRTTNGKGALWRHTIAQVRSLDAGFGERIPFLREVFDTVESLNPRALIQIELKGRRTAAPVAALIAEYTRTRGWPPERFLVSSFHRTELRLLVDAGLRLGILFPRSAARFRPLARALRAWSIHPPLRHTSQRLVERIHANGQKVFVYTVNDSRDMALLRAWGVDGIFTDYPDRLRLA